MNTLLVMALAIPFMGTASTPKESTGKRVAMLISSYGTQVPELSYDLEELAQAYLVLTDNGIALDIVSPAGGAVPVKTNKDDLPYIQRFKGQTPALRQLASTIAAKDVDRDAYDAIFIVGGSGAMMDLPTDPGVQQLLTHFVARGRSIAAVCHGPAALVDIKTPDGSYLVTGKRVCSFTNLEEKALSAENLANFPFFIEDKMRERQAFYSASAPLLPHIAVDGNLITAQNPGSVARAAEALVIKLGLPLKPRVLFRDEATMALIARARVSGPVLIDLALSTAPDAYDLNYLALYAYYSYRLAQNDVDRRTELGIMETVVRHFSHPMLLDRLVRTQQEQGFDKKASATLALLAKKYPDHDGLPELKKLLTPE